MKFFNVMSFEEALCKIADNFDPDASGTETVPLEKVAGRRSGRDISAVEELPDYSRSTVDGYAVRAADTYGATESVPSLLNCLGKTEMGVVGAFTLKKGETVYVPTGGAIPCGADAAVMIEHTEIFGDGIAVYKPVAVSENVIAKGTDLPAGKKLLGKYEKISALKCGLLAAAGFGKIEVLKRVKAAVISTGDEIVGIEEKSKKGQIRDTNATINSVLCENAGMEVVRTERVGDGFEKLDAALKRAAAEADVVLISGGSSVGSRDFTERVLESEGEIFVKGVALKPGKPALAAKMGKKLVFGLPGHPMACLLTLKLLALGAMEKKYGDGEAPFVFAQTEMNFPSSPGRLTVQPVKLRFEKDGARAIPLFYKSGMVSVLAEADGYMLIPCEQEGVAKGASVKVYLL